MAHSSSIARTLIGFTVFLLIVGCGSTGDGTSSDDVGGDAGGDTIENTGSDTNSNTGNDTSEADIAAPVECPEHAHESSGPGEMPCECDPEYHWNEDGSACVQCPENRIYKSDGTCECPSGYIVITDGSCQNASACPPNAYHKDGGDCICMDGYYYTGDPTIGCLTAEDWPCPENSHVVEDLEEGTVGCSCDNGFVANFWKNACVSPGEECSESEGWKKVEVNGQLWMCCPPDASTFLKSEGGEWEAGCTCDNGQPFDYQKGICP